MGSLSELHDKDKAKPFQLKIQMTYQENLMKDAKVESEVLQKRLREAGEDMRRAQKLLSESLATRKELEDKVNDLKHSLIIVGARSPKSK